jgi:elongator complex protein 3
MPKIGRNEIEALKKKHASAYGLAQVVGNDDLIAAAKALGMHELVPALRKGSVRSKSGVAVVAVMIRPVSCPYNCAYCPTSDIAAKSYTGHEPAALRARQNEFDAFRQAAARLRQFGDNGHETSKCEAIVMGGTFNVQPLEYQREFLKGLYDAFNEQKSDSLEQAIRQNETAPHRMVALTFETRPDCASPAQVSQLLEWGATRIELGVQSLSDEKLHKVRRGHGVSATVAATANCKDSFLKVCYHFMPGLFSSPQEDVAMFRRLFDEPEFRPDMLKIYPTLVIAGTELHDMWQRGEFTPYDTAVAAEVIAECKRYVPDYVRIMRVDRDIPTHQIAGGVKNLNLREYVAAKCIEKEIKCRCIRCRQAGISELKFGKKVDEGAVELKRLDYEASKGMEVFLSYEDVTNDLLVGFLRLRLPNADNVFRNEIDSTTAGVRELRVYGEHVAVGEKLIGAEQHHGYGKRLLLEAERIAKEEWDCGKVLVTSGVGVREYYYKRGYAREGAYVAKPL